MPAFLSSLLLGAIMAATNEDSNKDEISQKALDDMEPLDFSKVPKGPQILAALAGTL